MGPGLGEGVGGRGVRWGVRGTSAKRYGECKAMAAGTELGLGRARPLLGRAHNPPAANREDIDQSLVYAAWRLEEREVPLSPKR